MRSSSKTDFMALSSVVDTTRIPNFQRRYRWRRIVSESFQLRSAFNSRGDLSDFFVFSEMFSGYVLGFPVRI